MTHHEEQIRTLCRALLGAEKTLATAESCTGGGIAKALTELPGSSAVFLGGAVTYTDAMKQTLLGVSQELLDVHTAVSAPCAKAMAEGIRERTGACLAVSATGYAGPGGGTEKDPVGTVYIGIASPRACFAERFSAPAPAESSRKEIREAVILRALELLLRETEALSEQ